MNKIIITGAAGEVGLNLLCVMKEDKILDKYEIIAIDKNVHNLSILRKLFPEVKALHVDLSKKGDWHKYFKNAYAVIQLQAQISSPYYEPYFNNNVLSVKNVIETCEKFKIKRLIHASSSVVISVAEDHYTNTKREGEIIVKNSNVPFIMLRPTLMFGCFDIKHLGYLTRFFKFPIFPMPGSGNYIRQPLFVEDFCRIILSAMNKSMDNKIYNIAGKDKHHLIDLLKIYAKEMNKKIFFLKIPLPIFYLLIKIYGFLNRKTRIVPDQLTALTAGDIFPIIKWDKIFGVKPTTFIQGTKKMVNSPYFKYGKEMIRLEE